MVARDTFVKMLCMQILLTEYHLLSGKYERSGITVTDLDIVKGFSFTMSLLILNFSHAFVIGKRSSLMVSALDSGARCPDSSPGRDIVLCPGERHLLSRCLSPPRCIKGYRQT